MTSAYFAPLVLLPTIITKPGKYLTRNGETVVVWEISTKHDLGCIGHYYQNGLPESWHKSGRIYATSETANDIVSLKEETNG